MDILRPLVVIFFMTTTKFSSAVKKQINCEKNAVKPDKEAMKLQHRAWLGDDTETHSTFDLNPHVYKERVKDYTHNVQQTIYRQRIYGRAKCRKRLNTAGRDLMDTSLCPWYVEITYDKDRFPEEMARAQCRCKHCYNFDGTKLKVKSNFIGVPRCKEIKQNYKVLRAKKNSKGELLCDAKNTTIHLYENSFEEVTIGCTCALKKDKKANQKNIFSPK